VLSFFEIGSPELFAQAGFKPQFSHLSFQVARITGVGHQYWHGEVFSSFFCFSSPCYLHTHTPKTNFRRVNSGEDLNRLPLQEPSGLGEEV
jgi:hypothetical protein